MEKWASSKVSNCIVLYLYIRYVYGEICMYLAAVNISTMAAWKQLMAGNCWRVEVVWRIKLKLNKVNSLSRLITAFHHFVG